MRATVEEFEAADIRRFLGRSRKAHLIMLWGCAVSVEFTAPNFGGSRQWFICPVCTRRCALLYRSHHKGGIGCRVCQKLSYTSQHEMPLERAIRRASKIRRRLGWPPGIANGEAGRPPRMHRQTFVALVVEHRRIVMQINQMARAFLEERRFKRHP